MHQLLQRLHRVSLYLPTPPTSIHTVKDSNPPRGSIHRACRSMTLLPSYSIPYTNAPSTGHSADRPRANSDSRLKRFLAFFFSMASFCVLDTTYHPLSYLPLPIHCLSPLPSPAFSTTSTAPGMGPPR